ncbi:MFS transporter [candidate division KSB1 bacterium]|nr:MFS transporter [candidate division KSB1 bacterium]
MQEWRKDSENRITPQSRKSLNQPTGRKMNQQNDFDRKKQAIKYLRWGIVVLLMLGMVNSYFDRMNMSFAASSISREFGRWVQIFKVMVNHPSEETGAPVAMTDEHAVIGEGISNDNAELNHLAYFLHREDTVWTVGAHLKPGAVSGDSIIARAVAMSGDRAVIGAIEAKTETGIVYVLNFQNSDAQGDKGEWVFQTTLVPSTPVWNISFGKTVSIDSNRIIVGAPTENGGTGAAYIFREENGGWIEESHLKPDERQPGSEFGNSVMIDGDYAMVGFPDGGDGRGSVIVYHKKDGQWTRLQALIFEDGTVGDRFGCSVAMNGEYAVIGADETNSGPGKIGAAYIYKKNDKGWEYYKTLKPDAELRVTNFGRQVALHGNHAIIGSGNGAREGTAFIFHREGKIWVQQAVLTPQEKVRQFGKTVAISGEDYAFVGGRSEDSGNAIGFIFRHYPMDPAKMGLILAMFFWAYGIMQVPAGRLVDKFGIRKLYTTSFFLWAFVATAFGLATSIWMFIALRALLGVLESVSAPASMAFIGRYFDERERGLATGIYLAGTKLGPSIGGILAAWLIGTFGWRMLFILCGLVPLIWLIPWEYYYRKLENRIGERNVKVGDVQGSLSTAGKKLIPLKTLFKYKKTWGVFWGAATYSYVLVLYLSWLPTYFREQMHFSLAKMGAFSGIAFGGVAVMVPLAGAAADFLIRRGMDTTKVRKGFIIAGFFMGSLIIPVPYISNPDYAVTVLLIAIVSMGMATANTWAIMQAVAPENTTGTLAGVQNLGGSVGAAVAPLLTGFMVSASGTFNSAFILAGVIMLSGILNYIFLIGKVERIQVDQ